MTRQTASLKRMLSAICNLTQIRLELISIELSEEKERLLIQFYLCLAAAVFGMLALITFTAVIATVFWESYRWQALAALAIMYSVLAALCAGKARTKLRAAPPFLATTRAEFEKDYETLTRSH